LVAHWGYLEEGSSWENHHCGKHGNTQISPNLSHKLWKSGRSYQTKPGFPSGCQVNIKCFYAKSTCLGSHLGFGFCHQSSPFHFSLNLIFHTPTDNFPLGSICHVLHCPCCYLQ
jgi:hypothetical protein